MKRFLYNTLRQLGDQALNFLFPVSCVVCASPADWLCAGCRGSIPEQTRLVCFFCNQATTDGFFCADCAKGKYCKAIRAASVYASPELRVAIHLFKYASVRVLALPLAQLFVRFYDRWPFLFSPRTVFVPVPLHRRKLNHRGYNQSHLLLAHFLRIRGGVCGCWLLLRRRYTKQQVDCNEEGERRENVFGAFAYAGPVAPVWSPLILIDDVATTSATLESCAHALYDAGARDITALVLAKG